MKVIQLLITPTAFVRTAIGMVISFHLPGLKRHRVAEWRRWFLPIRSRRAA